MGTLDRRGEKATKKKTAPESARQFLRRASEARMARYDAPGVGEDIRIRGEGVEGAALVHQESIVHVGVFSIQWLIKMPAISHFCLQLT